MHARTDEEIFVKVQLKILATQGSSEWNEESIKALARVLVRQARDKYAFPTERHQSVYLQTVLCQFDGTSQGCMEVCVLSSAL